MTVRVIVPALAALGLGLSASAQEAVVDARLIHAQAVTALEANPGLQRNPFAVLVKFQPGATDAARAGAKAAAGATTLRQYRLVPGLELVRTTLAPEAAITALRASPSVAYAEPDYVARTSEDPPQNVPVTGPFAYFNYQWGAHNTGQVIGNVPGTPGVDVNAPEAWWITTGDPNFVIAIIDSGTEYSHADLAANTWINPGEIAGNGIDDDANGYVDDVRGWDFYSGDNDPIDENGHGTHVAGTVGAVGTNGLGVAGMMWECRLMPLRFLGPNGTGYYSDAILALQYAAEKGVKVSNHSWGGGGFSQSLYDACSAARNVGHILVAAAGNGGPNGGYNLDRPQYASYPASFDLDNIIAVAATGSNDEIAAFSNYGRTSVDLGAPGVSVLSTVLTTLYGPGPYPYGIYAYSSGTSMAAPHVSGIVGLVYVQNPGWMYQQVRARVISTARPVASLSNITVSGGVVDAAAALGVSVPPPALPPAAPGTPTVTKIGGGQVRVAWADNSPNEDGFEVQREKKSGGNWINTMMIANLGANITTGTDEPGPGTFRYAVRAYNAAGVSAWSGWRQINN